MKAFIVWNETKTEGYVTFDAQVAYEARKGSDSNCFDADGRQMVLAQDFTDRFAAENCTIQEIELEA